MSIENRPVVYKGELLQKECTAKGIEFPVRDEILFFEPEYSDVETLKEDFSAAIDMGILGNSPTEVAKCLNGKIKIDNRSGVLALHGIVSEKGGKKALEMAIMSYAGSTPSVQPRFLQAIAEKKSAGYCGKVIKDAQTFLDTTDLTVQDLENALPSILTD